MSRLQIILITIAAMAILAVIRAWGAEITAMLFPGRTKESDVMLFCGITASVVLFIFLSVMRSAVRQ